MAKAPRSALLLLVASLAFLRWTAPSFAGTRSPKVALHSALQQKLKAFGRQKLLVFVFVTRLLLLSTLLGLAAGKRAGPSGSVWDMLRSPKEAAPKTKAKPVTYVVTWAHMKSQPQRLDGEYVEAGTWNGKPKYKQRDGPGVIFYEGFTRKLPDGHEWPTGWKLGVKDVPPDGKYWMYGRQYPWIIKRKEPPSVLNSVSFLQLFLVGSVAQGVLSGQPEMGLSDDKLAEAHTILAGLRCAICQEVFVDPVCGVECQHVFCSSCIGRAVTRQSQCPLCRVPLDPMQLRQSQPIQALVDDLKVRCDYRMSGCGWTGRLQDCAAHQAACPVKLTLDLADELDKKAKKFQEESEKAHALAIWFQELSRKLVEQLNLSTARVDNLAKEKAELKDQVTSLEQRLEEATKVLLERMSRWSATQVQVFVRDPKQNKMHVMNVNIDEDTAVLKWYISRQTGWRSTSFYLSCLGRIMQPGMTGRDYGIDQDTTLYMNACQ
ncbi:PDZ domain-containing RING finger protein 4 [Symbiodinium microadriaticum]|uniref:PDZ domain-containing RING finger protein 4 n=1 Tax=Symbiodinium microadriaticum TaxID=2951 RepID=A0A1Q9DFP1_SYMMI|nr:PDZ domain-containing RING finger protein 4 [Symbiodinium microadriaticum]